MRYNTSVNVRIFKRLEKHLVINLLRGRSGECEMKKRTIAILHYHDFLLHLQISHIHYNFFIDFFSPHASASNSNRCGEDSKSVTENLFVCVYVCIFWRFEQ